MLPPQIAHLDYCSSRCASQLTLRSVGARPDVGARSADPGVCGCQVSRPGPSGSGGVWVWKSARCKSDGCCDGDPTGCTTRRAGVCIAGKDAWNNGRWIV
ncbi:hypothetical protein SUGI_0404920 [Cryptomeria japonica]|nr:hypothetical protein SUGI_0404920 [Cryptomeria japonica]